MRRRAVCPSRSRNGFNHCASSTSQPDNVLLGVLRFDRGGITGSMPRFCQVVTNIVAVIALVAQEPVRIDVVQLHQRLLRSI